MENRFDTVTFLSDYGHKDEFVGVVHSVLRALAPGVHVLDLTHEIRRHDVRAGGLALARAANYLNPGVVLAVVDPGVGTDRRGIAIEVGEGQSVLVGPDNGLLAPVVALCGGATKAVALTNTEFHQEAPGPTFDGRDVFAPVAAAICTGTPLEELGDVVDPATLVPGLIPVMRNEGDTLVAEVLWVDGFGNCQLNVDPDDLEGWDEIVRLTLGGTDTRTVPVVDSFGAIPKGGHALLVDSYGLLTIAANQGSAAAELQIGEGTEVVLAPVPDDEVPATGATTPVTLGRKDGA